MHHSQRMEAGIARFLFKSAARGTENILATAQLAARLRSQARKRELNADRGTQVPPVVIMSVTRKCNLNCEGCYARALRDPDDACRELSDERFAEIAEEAIGLGVSSFLIAGGEPLMRPSLLRRLAAMPGHASAVFTNGTLLGPVTLDVFTSGRLSPVISIEGDAAFTGERRGEGVHEGAMAAAAFLRGVGIPFGFSVTLTSRNAESVLSGEFLMSLAERGAGALFLVEYVPVSPGTRDLVLGDADRKRLMDPARFSRLPYPVATLPGDEAAYGGCLAAGRGFIHVDDEGRVEACPFAPWSDSSVAEGSFAAALKSPLMARIRERHGELTEGEGGCALWSKAGWVASLGACERARAGAAVA